MFLEEAFGHFLAFDFFSFDCTLYLFRNLSIYLRSFSQRCPRTGRGNLSLRVMKQWNSRILIICSNLDHKHLINQDKSRHDVLIKSRSDSESSDQIQILWSDQIYRSCDLVKYRSCDLIKYRSCNLIKYRSCDLIKYRSCDLIKYRSCDLIKYRSYDLIKYRSCDWINPDHKDIIK